MKPNILKKLMDLLKEVKKPLKNGIIVPIFAQRQDTFILTVASRFKRTIYPLGSGKVLGRSLQGTGLFELLLTFSNGDSAWVR